MLRHSIFAMALVPALSLWGYSPHANAQRSLAHPTHRATDAVVRHRTTDIDGVTIFHREAGPANAPVVVLLHGFPSSSHMFRKLIPALSDRYHVIAPDYPGFGESAAPDRAQ